MVSVGLATAALVVSALALTYVYHCVRQSEQIAAEVEAYAVRAEAAAKRVEDTARGARDHTVHFNGPVTLGDIERWREQASKELGIDL